MPAVEVIELRKEFVRRRPSRRARVVALDDVSLTTLLTYERSTVRVFGHDVAQEERAVRRLVNRVSVEASFLKKMGYRCDARTSPVS